jgi:hypothetical protein
VGYARLIICLLGLASSGCATQSRMEVVYKPAFDLNTSSSAPSGDLSGLSARICVESRNF